MRAIILLNANSFDLSRHTERELLVHGDMLKRVYTLEIPSEYNDNPLEAVSYAYRTLQHHNPAVAPKDYTARSLCLGDVITLEGTHTDSYMIGPHGFVHLPIMLTETTRYYSASAR